MENKDLLVFANEFPYANYETYMETEMKHWKQFDHIFIFSLQLRRKHKRICRKVTDNCTVIPVEFNPLGYILWTIVILIDKNFYEELKMLIAQHKLSIFSLVQLIVYVARSHYEAYIIRKKIRIGRYDIKNPVFYSYRFGYQPYVALLVKNKLFPESPMFCRAHGYDLYEDRKRTDYIPARRAVLKNITKCFPVSDNGTIYLQSRYPEYKNKIETRYLGTVGTDRTIIQRENGLRLVSCSSFLEVKRVDLIIDALALIDNHQITWTHFGSGILMEKMKSRAKEKLSANITVELRGNVDNKTIIQEYGSGFYDLFINVSKSEGVPVSIMEAISAGIPVVATDAGGTREIIQNGVNGILLPVDTTAKEISDAILSFVNMKDEEYRRYSDCARKIWEERFDADDNYERFMREISK